MLGRKHAAAIALATSALFAAPVASAYCFLVPDPSSPYVNLMSCTQDPAGAVTWEYACAEIGINPDGLPSDVTLSQFRAAVYDAADTWNAARCTDGSTPAFQFDNYPDVNAPFGFNPTGPNANLFSFRNPWPSDLFHLPGEPYDSIMYYNLGAGHTIVYDVDINPGGPVPFASPGVAGGAPISLNVLLGMAPFPTSLPVGTVDLQTFATQELGFMLGLGLSTDPTSIMNADLDLTVPHHTLSADDVAGFCALYPAATRTSDCEADPYGGFAGSTGCSCELGTRAQGNAPLAVTVLALAGALVYRRRRKQLA